MQLRHECPACDQAWDDLEIEQQYCQTCGYGKNTPPLDDDPDDEYDYTDELDYD